MRDTDADTALKRRKFIKDKNGCIICISHKAKSHNGYPLIGINGKMERLNRVMYKKFNGKIPEGMVVCHKCDNRQCVNPDHLFLGTNADNSKDMINKGRQSKGENRTYSKLTENQVLEVRKDKRTQKEIAEHYGVSQPLISNIKCRIAWKYL